MNVRSLLALGLLTLAAFVGGCGGADCTSLCEDYNNCDGVTKNNDCAGTCSDGAADADATGCRGEYDASISCAAGRADICDNTDTSCNDEGTKLFECVVKFCTENPDDKVCTG